MMCRGVCSILQFHVTAVQHLCDNACFQCFSKLLWLAIVCIYLCRFYQVHVVHFQQFFMLFRL